MAPSTRRNTSQAPARVKPQPIDNEALIEQTRSSSRHLVEAVLDCARDRPGAAVPQLAR